MRATMCARATCLLGGIALAAVLGVLGVPCRGHAQPTPRTVVLASNDAELAAALRSTLAPWDLVVIVVEDEELGGTMPAAADRGRELAERNGSIAAAWISVLADGAAVWVYDRASEEVNARRLASFPPYDEVTAAAVALSIKTLLLHTAAAPEPAESLESAESGPEAAASAELPPPVPAVARLELSGGLRALGTVPLDAEPRLGLGLTFRPSAVPLVVGLRARSSLSGIRVEGTGYFGQWLTFDIHAVLATAFGVGGPVDVGFGVELGASVALLEGSLTGERTGLLDADPTGRAFAEIGALLLPFLHLALRVALFLTPRSRSFVVGPSPVFSVGHAALDVDLVFEVPLATGSIERR